VMIFTRKSLSRRMPLLGFGTAVALPFFDSTPPALAPVKQTPMRIAFFYLPNGIILKDWTPAGEVAGYLGAGPALLPGGRHTKYKKETR
jgi:hypothetical protein